MRRTQRVKATAIATLVAMVLAMGTGMASADQADRHIATDLPRCKGPTVLVIEGEPMPCDIAPPQRLDVILTGDATSHADACDDMGGTAVRIPAVATVCQHIDY